MSVGTCTPAVRVVVVIETDSWHTLLAAIESLEAGDAAIARRLNGMEIPEPGATREHLLRMRIDRELSVQAGPIDLPTGELRAWVDDYGRGSDIRPLEDFEVVLREPDRNKPTTAGARERRDECDTRAFSAVADPDQAQLQETGS